jgi:hypothetical protein
MRVGAPPGVDAAFHAARSAAGRLPDVVKPGFHRVGTHWIRGFIAFQLAKRTRIVMLMVPV